MGTGGVRIRLRGTFRTEDGFRRRHDSLGLDDMVINKLRELMDEEPPRSFVGRLQRYL